MAMILLGLSAVCMLAGFVTIEAFYDYPRIRALGSFLLAISFALAGAAVAVNSNTGGV